MRRFLAGTLFSFLLIPTSVALAQVRGEVESIGFQNRYRPDCWTPMTIKIVPETNKTDVYQIQVRQEDLDRDRPIFTRTISVTGNTEGQVREQRFRAYFLPQPTRGGLPDARDGTQTLADLDAQLTVNLCTASGKVIARLPITSSITNIDPKPGMWDTRRGTRFILAVTEGRSQPVYLDPTTATGLVGVVENVQLVLVRPDELPENVIGYDAIDGIVWLNADPASLKTGAEEKWRALDSYVRGGGRLVICQTPEWQKTLQFGELLPVQIEGVGDLNEPQPLRDLAQPPPGSTAVSGNLVTSRARDAWALLRPPFRVARAQPKPGAVVDTWIDWPDKSRTPYIARQRVSLGSVTWVAQDLADPAITATARTGWPYVWDAVFDWNDDPVVLTNVISERDVGRYAQGLGVDIGFSLIHGMDLDSKTAWLITLAIVFFIAYWLVAGPGVFGYLVSRRRTEMSWFAFAAAALVATGLTVLLVKLTLRGPPELKHFTVVRAAPDAPAKVTSRFGLYIPRDGLQRIELRDAAPNTVSTISAFPIHFAYLQGERGVQGPEYRVPVVEATSNEPASVEIPYSSTMKKLQTTWRGQVEGKVEGSAALRQVGFIEGSITNGTGKRLRNVYIAFNFPGEGGFDTGKWVLYLPSWDAGITLDLNKEFNLRDDGQRFLGGLTDTMNPDRGRKVKGRVDFDWAPYWYGKLRTGLMGDNNFNDTNDAVRRTLPMLSFFESLPPSKNEGNRTDRFELLRRGGRYLDISHILSAGAMVVLAEAERNEAPLPLPLSVEGEPVTGSGNTFYQFILPLDHSKLEADLKASAAEEATTQPADNQGTNSGTDSESQRP
jgi:hypothetical protein